MQLGKRKLQILYAVISDYIHSAEPVGSRTIAKKYGMGISSATIRNEMSDLEEMGYLEQPHTSSGRIPSDKAYRLYVDRLMETRTLTEGEAEYIKKIYKQRTAEIEQIVMQVAKILSDITSYTSVVLGPQLNKVLIRHIQLIPVDHQYALLLVVTSAGIIKDTLIHIPSGADDGYLNRVSNMLTEHFFGKTFAEVDLGSLVEVQREMLKQREFFDSLIDALIESLALKEQKDIYLGGAANIFNFPEYHDILRAKTFLKVLDQKDLLYSLMSRFDEQGVSVIIGTENEYQQMQECSVVMATYRIGERVLGTMGVIGPTRMEYSKTVSVIHHVGESVSKYLTELFEK
jgi:heat-inducible transcriptional repressor